MEVKQIRVDGKDFLPVKLMAAFACRVAFFIALGFGMGAVAIIPWLAKSAMWVTYKNEAEVGRYQKLVLTMADEAARAEARMMVMEKACPLQVRAARAARNIGGE